MKYLTNADILAALSWRQATKKFDPKKHVSEEDFAMILEAARLSPSSFGLEPWNLIVVKDPALVTEIRTMAWGAKGKLPEASHLVIITAKTSQALQPDGPYVLRMLQSVRGMTEAQSKKYVKDWVEPWARDDYRRFESPQLLHEWAARQAYIALANMMTAAALRGIDSCPIEGFNIPKMTKLLEQSAGLDASQDLPVAMVAFGYRAEPARPKSRRCTEEVVREV